jgi:hypothetical protein
MYREVSDQKLDPRVGTSLTQVAGYYWQAAGKNKTLLSAINKSLRWYR